MGAVYAVRSLGFGGKLTKDGVNKRHAHKNDPGHQREGQDQGALIQRQCRQRATEKIKEHGDGRVNGDPDLQGHHPFHFCFTGLSLELRTFVHCRFHSFSVYGHKVRRTISGLGRTNLKLSRTLVEFFCCLPAG